MTPFFKLPMAVASGIARDQSQRRRAMFMLTLSALAMLFVGTFVLWNALADHLLCFAIYWMACLWVVVCIVFLAIYDLLMVMRRSRKEYTSARKNIFRDIDPH